MIQAVIISVLLLACTGFALPRHSWEFYYEKGLIQYRAGMYTDSMLNMELCLDANPRCYKAANILAGIYLKKQMKLKAKDYYETSLHIKDDQADIHCELGVLYEFFIQRDLAFKHFHGRSGSTRAISGLYAAWRGPFCKGMTPGRRKRILSRAATWPSRNRERFY